MPKTKGSKKHKKHGGNSKKRRTHSSSGRRMFLSDDMIALTSTNIVDYKKPPLDHFAPSTKVINADPGCDLNKSKFLTYHYNASPNELIRFSNLPFCLDVSLKRWKTDGTLADPGWTGWDGQGNKQLLPPGLELFVFFESIKIWIDGAQVPNGIGDYFQAAFERLNRLFSKSKVGELPKICSTEDFQGTSDELGLAKWKKNCSTENETAKISFSSGWQGQFPISSRTRTTSTITGEDVPVPWLHPGATIRIELRRREAFNSMVLYTEMQSAINRNPNTAVAIDKFNKIGHTINNLTVTFDSWVPDDSATLRRYQSLVTQEYLVDIPNVVLKCLPEGSSVVREKFVVPSNAKAAYLYFATNGEIFFDSNSKELTTPIFSIPSEISKIIVKFNGQNIFASEGLVKPGQTAHAHLQPSNQAYVKNLYSKGLWHSSSVLTMFPNTLSDKYLGAAQCLIFDLVSLNIQKGQVGEFEIICHTTGGLSRPYNAIFISTESHILTCTKTSRSSTGQNEYMWTSRPAT